MNTQTKIIAFIQARMSSQRLPGKILAAMHGKPLLEYLFERLERCPGLDSVVLITSTEASDDSVPVFCAAKDVPCFRGPLENVAQRFAQALDSYPCDAFVRISADSPLLDPAIVDKAVTAFREGDYDLVTNVQQRTYPKGQSVEVLRTTTYLDALSQFSTPYEREHVTPHFYARKEQYRIRNLACEERLGDVQTSVDTAEDMALLKHVLERMDKPHWEYGFRELVRMIAEERQKHDQ